MSLPKTIGSQWVDNRWAVRPASASGVFEAIARLGSLYSKRRLVWRGVPDFRYRIEPSIFRASGFDLPDALADRERATRDYETTLLNDALSWGLFRTPGGLATELQVMSQIQHNASQERVGTRLLDVTSDPFAALWFATDEPTASGMVYAINVQGVQEMSTHEVVDTGGLFGVPMERGNLSGALSRANNKLTLLRPEFPDARMAAQRGEFLFSSYPEDTSLEEYGIHGIRLPRPTELAKGDHDWVTGSATRTQGKPSNLTIFGVVVGTGHKPAIRKTLSNTYRTDQKRLFPDVAGFIASHPAPKRP